MYIFGGEERLRSGFQAPASRLPSPRRCRPGVTWLAPPGSGHAFPARDCLDTPTLPHAHARTITHPSRWPRAESYTFPLIGQGYVSTTPDCPRVLTLALTRAHSGRPAYFVAHTNPPKHTHISMSMCWKALVLANIRPILLAIQDTHKRTHSHTHTSRSTGTHRHEQGLRL